MNNIQLNIIANAQFQQVYAEVAKLKEAMASLQKVSVGGPFAPGIATEIKTAQSAFDSAILSTRAFTIQHVAMTDSVTKFGRQLEAGKLSLNNYYKIWRESAKGTSAELDALAASQARLNRSVAIADPLRPGYAKLVTDINGVVTAQEKAIFYQKALNTALHDGAMKVIDFGKNTQWMGRQLTVGLTMPLAMFGAAASQAYLKFDQQMTSMLKVYGSHAVVQSQETLKVIEQQVTSLADKLARTLGVAMTDTVEIAKTFSSIGLEGNNLIAATEATVKLQKLGDLTAQNAATSMVALQNVFKLQGTEIAQAVDFLNAAKHSTSTTMQDITEALPRVGPIIREMGGTYKDFAALLVALKESGVPAAQGANAIKSMLASIIHPTTAATAALKSMNINLNDIVNKNQNNVMGMVQGLQTALDKLPQNERLKAIEQLFGKFQFARVTALLDNLGRAGSQSAKVLELYGQTDAQLKAVAQQELDVASKQTPAARFQKMKATLQADMVPIGRTFLEIFTKVGNAVDKVIAAFKAIAHAMGPAAGILGKIIGSGVGLVMIAGPVLMLTGLFANLIGNLLKGANYMRMFKQGMDEAGPSQNKFVAGLENMRNFYQNLDAGIVAARNQMDLMPEAITSNAKAFDILSSSIATLTAQFEALTAAQAASMGGMGAAGMAFAERPLGAKLLPIVPRNHGGSIPGFSNGGGISVVPGPDHINYDSVLGSVPVGGFVLNKQASKNLLRGYNSGGNITAMLTPGEIVFDPSIAGPNRKALNALNNGYSFGGTIKRGLGNYGPIGPIHGELAIYESAIKNLIGRETSSLSKEELSLAVAKKAAEKYGLEKSISGLSRFVGREPYINPTTGYVEGSALAMDKKFGLWKPEDTYDEFGSKITNKGAIHVGYSRKGTVGLYGLSADKSILSSFNTKKATSGLFNTGNLHEISDYISFSKAYGKDKSGFNRIYGSTDIFLEKMPSNIVSFQSKQDILNRLSSSYETRALSLSRLTDINDPYSSLASTIMGEYSISNPMLVSAYRDFESQASAYNAQTVAALKAQRGPSGAQDISIIVNGEKISFGKLEGSDSGAAGSLYFHSFPARANGGPVSNGSPYLVGEKGPELFVPGQSGNIIPHYAVGGTIRAGKHNYGKVSFMGGKGVVTNAYTGEFPYAPGLNLTGQLMEPINNIARSYVAGAKLAVRNMAEANLPVVGQLKYLGSNIKNAGIESAKNIQNTAMMQKENLKNIAINTQASMNNLVGRAKNSFAIGSSAVSSSISSGLGKVTSGISRMGTAISESATSFYNRLDASYSKMGMMKKMGLGMGLMMGGGMLGNAVGGTAGQAISMGTMGAGMAMQMGLGMSSMGIFAGVAVGATLLMAGFKHLNEVMRQNANLMKSEFSLSSMAAQHLGVGLNNLSNIHLLALDTNSKNTAESMRKNKDAIDALTQSYQNATDQQTKDTINKIKGMSGKDLQDYINKTYATYLAAGSDPTKAKQEVAAQLAAAGKTNLSMLDVKMPTYSTSVQGFKQQMAGLSPLTQMVAGHGYVGEIAGEGAQQAGLAISSLAMSSPSNVNQVVKSLKDWQKAIFENKFVYQEFVDNIKKSSPELAKLIDKMHAAGASTENLARATSLVNAGIITTTDEFKKAAMSVSYYNDALKASGILDKLSTVAPETTTAIGQQVQKNQDLIDSKQSLIDKINAEIQKRDELYNAQMRNIEAQQQQMNLEAEVVKARGSGNLIQLAVAQQNLAIQKTKDAMAAAKEKADTSDKNRIAALEAEIKALQKQKDTLTQKGPTTTTGTSARDKATGVLGAGGISGGQVTNVNTFTSNMPSTVTGLEKLGLKLPDIQAIYQKILDDMDWTTFSKNFSAIYDGLAKSFGDKAAAAMVLNTVTIDLQGKIDDAINSGKIKGISVEDIQSFVDDVKGLLTHVEAGKDPATLKTISAAYTTFATDLIEATKKPMTKSQFVQTVQTEFAKMAKKVYDADMHSKDPAVRAKAQADYDYIIAQGKSYITTVFHEPDAASAAKHRSGLLGVWDNIVSAWKSIWNSIFGAPKGNGVPAPTTTNTTTGNQQSISLAALTSAGIKTDVGTTFTDQNGKKWKITKIDSTSRAAIVVGAASGGYISKFDMGGAVIGAGGPTSDSIPALLSNGEYVVKAASVSKYGKSFMDAVNNKTYSVPGNNFSAYSANDMSDIASIHSNRITNNINVYPPEGADANQVANLVIDKINQSLSKRVTRRTIN